MVKKVFLGLVVVGSLGGISTLKAMPSACSAPQACAVSCGGLGSAPAVARCMQVCSTQVPFHPGAFGCCEPVACGLCMVCTVGIVVLTQSDCLRDCAAKTGQVVGLSPRPQAPRAGVDMSGKNE